MAFNIGGVYGLGNWSIGNIKLPELGITESLGGNKDSLSQANKNTVGAAANYIIPKAVNSVSNGSVLGDTTNNSSSKSSSSSSSGGGSSSSSSKGGSSSNGVTDKSAFYDSLNDAFKDTSNFLGGLETYVRNQQGDILNGINAGFDAQKPLFEQARTQGINAINQQTDLANRQGTNILNSARQLYNELGNRNQNLFGTGALSSVGQAASEISNREAQRNFGNIRQNVADTIQTLQTKAQEVEQNFQVQMQNLESKRQQAISQAQAEFSQKLYEIQQQRGQLESWKTQEKLDALKNFRDQQAQINAEARQFAYSMASQRDAYNQQLALQKQALEDSVNTSVNEGTTAYNTNMNNALSNASDWKSANVAMGESYNPYEKITGNKKNVLEDAYSLYNRALG